jgi:beta-glucosidase
VREPSAADPGAEEAVGVPRLRRLRLGATHSTAYAANSGLDKEMPSGVYFDDDLKHAVQTGEVSMARLNDMVHRVLRSMLAHGLFEHPIRVGRLPVRADARATRRIGTDAAVLLKNAGRELPLHAARLRSIAVIGADAKNSKTGGGGSARVIPIKADTPLRAIRRRAAYSLVRFARGNDPVSPGNPGLQPVPSGTLTPSSGTRRRGLTGTYYPNATFSGPPNIVRTDPGVYFDWHWFDLPVFSASSAPPMPPAPTMPQPLSVRWTGTFTAPKTGRLHLRPRHEQQRRRHGADRQPGHPGPRRRGEEGHRAARGRAGPHGADRLQRRH